MCGFKFEKSGRDFSLELRELVLVSLSKEALSRGGDKKTIDFFIHN